MEIKATVVADSINTQGNRITTMEVVFPRFILAELNTHRMFSRNSASSRAIPFKKMVKMVQENPFVPIAWQKDHKGMQGTEYITDFKVIQYRTGQWLKARDAAVDAAVGLKSTLIASRGFYNNQGGQIGQILEEHPDGEPVTKQFCNRLLEPFMWHKVLITATEWENFFALRCPQYVYLEDKTQKTITYRSKKDYINNLSQDEYDRDELLYKQNEFWQSVNEGQAEIHMMALAEAMWDAMNESTPRELKAGEWHIPYGDNTNANTLDSYLRRTEMDWDIDARTSFSTQKQVVEQTRIKIATARCAQVSYTTIDDEGKVVNYEKDIKLHDRLLESKHMSPFEHCARVMSDEEYSNYIIGTPKPAYRDLGFDTKEEQGWCRNFRGFIQYRYFVENNTHLV